MITLAIDGSLHCRRQALAYVYDAELVHQLFALAPERYKGREPGSGVGGGYVRVLRTVNRKGDNADMGILELT